MNTAFDPHTLVSLPVQGKAELLFLLCHGVGGQAAHMAPFAAALRAQYPQAAIVSLNGPDAFEGAGGYQWFSVADLSEINRIERIDAALPAFITRIRAWGRHFELDWPMVALAGFSQGGIMALEAVQAEPQLAGRVLAFSGRHVDAPTHAPADTTVHLFHGIDDTVIPYRASVDSAQCLMALGGDVTADVLPGLGHALHTELMDKAIGQLRTFLPKKVWRQAMSEAPVIPRAASSEELGG